MQLLYVYYYEKLKFISVNFFFAKSIKKIIDADLICDYIILKLMQKFTLKELMSPLLKIYNVFLRRKFILGYRFLIMGRLTRKDRAIFKWYQIGPLPLSTRISRIDYANRQVALKYSLCSMKI